MHQKMKYIFVEGCKLSIYKSDQAIEQGMQTAKNILELV